jgi:hypothetical protein
VRTRLAALAILFLAAHLPDLPAGLEDIDSVNFAMGVRDFDVAQHRPHPPGYPVYIALGKLSTPLVAAAGVAGAPSRGLSIWSAVSGAVLAILLWWFFRVFDDSPSRAWWATALTIASPLFWFTALRPLSDMTGLAVTIASQALLASAILARTSGPDRALVAGAFLAGLAAGVRSQTVLLTLPLLLLAVALPGSRSMRARVTGMLAAAAGALVWTIPVLAASGGLQGYFTALAVLAGDDFAGVIMLWSTRTVRVLLNAIQYSFLWPWGELVTGAIVTAAAAIGTARFAWRSPRPFLLFAAAFGPYAIFHLLLQETLTVRYVLPLMPGLAFLAVWAAPRPDGMAMKVAGSVAVVWFLAMGVPAARAFGRDGTPTMRLLKDVTGTLGMHAFARRPVEWTFGEDPHRVMRNIEVLPAPHGREWLSLVSHWRSRPDGDVSFIADPRRTDLQLFDPQARQLQTSYRWTFPVLPYVGGARPGNADLYWMRPPGWMLDRGWAVTAEVAGVTERDGVGPHVAPSVAWIRARPDGALLMIGGRHLGAEGAPASRISVTIEDRQLAAFEVPPGFFFRTVALPPAGLSASSPGYVAMRVSAAAAAAGPGPAPRVALEQFDLQPDGAPMLGFADGWLEPEYNRMASQAWRWMSERAQLWVRPIGRDVTLSISGESPLRYFDRAPDVRVSVGGVEVGKFTPAADFIETVRLPDGLLTSAGGEVTIRSTEHFVPAERGQGVDRRHLALRIYTVTAQ